MNTAFEPALAALFARLEAAATLTFTADETSGSAILSSVSAFAGLFAGLPTFGPGVPRGATIASLDPVAGTVTLSDPLSASATGAAFSTGFQTTGRRVQHWTQVAAQPAMFLRHIGTSDDADGLYIRSTLECEIWIYANAGKDPNATPDTALACLDQMVRGAFAPDTDYGDPRFTLGGLAYWCRIEGRSDYSPGDQGGQALARIPVRITLP